MAFPCSAMNTEHAGPCTALQICIYKDLCSHSYKHAHAQIHAHLTHTIHAWFRCVWTHTQACLVAVFKKMCKEPCPYQKPVSDVSLHVCLYLLMD